jgi:hypothetical protein
MLYTSALYDLEESGTDEGQNAIQELYPVSYVLRISLKKKQIRF